MKQHLKARALRQTIMIVCSSTAIMFGVILVVLGGLASITAFGVWMFDACNRVPFHWNWLKFLGYGMVFTMPVLFMSGAVFLVFRDEYQKQLDDLNNRRW
ncbi:hypothetical protein [Acidithiobacillus sp.]|uniref:hypothetical protein n=1 Tax=Acidithiobacillus sp. TaxID=1872118 RepID=UPI00231740C2|nr:hypothetical protein [Acidithiobacillus sp.]MDA8247179.1 hypothetical protein [Acidithiobacillus sp.]